MKLNSLNDLFVEQLKDVYSAEKQMIQALPKMAKAASTPELQQAFQQHLEITQQQKDRLDTIFQRLNATPGRTKSKGMEGLIDEGDEFLKSGPSPDVVDAGLIASAQKVEHYEIAAYGTLRTFANLLGDKQSADLLQQTLDEEGNADHMLTQIAESKVNVHAEHRSGGTTTTGTTGTGTRRMSTMGRRSTTGHSK